MFIYGIIIRLYYLVILCASLFNPKAKKWITGRRKLRRQLIETDFSKQKWVWFHCSSLGEFQDGKCLMEAYKEHNPEINILLTFFSSTGFELKKGHTVAEAIYYLPLDTRSNAEFFLQTVRPKEVFFIRHDIWPNYVSECARRNIPAYLVSFTLNSGSRFLTYPLKNFYRKIARHYSCIFVQDSGSAGILNENNWNEHIIVTGNSRVDRIIAASLENNGNEIIEKFVSGNFCCIAGSTHVRDRRIFLEAFHDLKGEDIRWIIAPHEFDAIEMRNAKEDLKEKMVLYSEAGQITDRTKLLWIDKVGFLADLYRYAHIAFIGGGFDRTGIHSILEPLIHNCAIGFGPNDRAYIESQELLYSGGAEIIRNKDELIHIILRFKNNRELLAKQSAANKKYLIESAGATAKIMEYLDNRNNLN